jgi:hypothetical protein
VERLERDFQLFIIAHLFALERYIEAELQRFSSPPPSFR